MTCLLLIRPTSRWRVVYYLKQEKGTQKQAAEIFDNSERSVRRIWQRYKESGKRGPKAKKRGVPPGSKKITAEQSAVVRRLIKDKLPDQLKLPYGLWTKEAVQQLIEQRYGVVLNKKAKSLAGRK